MILIKGYIIYRGIAASAIHCKSMLQANTGMWGYGNSSGNLRGTPFVKRRSMTSCSVVSHLTGSPSKNTTSTAGKLGSIFSVCKLDLNNIHKLHRSFTSMAVWFFHLFHVVNSKRVDGCACLNLQHGWLMVTFNSFEGQRLIILCHFKNYLYNLQVTFILENKIWTGILQPNDQEACSSNFFINM